MKKKLLYIIPVVLIGIFAVCFVVLRGHSVDKILTSDLFEPYGFEVNRPVDPIYSFYGNNDRPFASVETVLYVRGEYGVYYFTPGRWTDRQILRYVRISEDGIRFAREWLDIEDGEPLDFVFNTKKPKAGSPITTWNGGGAYGSAVYISMSSWRMPTLIVHEAVHAILRQADIRSNFPLPPETATRGFAQFLEEGLCNVIDFLFYMETEHRYSPNQYGWFRRAGADYPHIITRGWFRFHKDFEDEAEYGTEYPQLMSYETAASFIYYLIENKGSRQDFMRVFADIHSAADVYGTGFDELVGEWLDFLDNRNQ
jgi:hypothetical protein